MSSTLLRESGAYIMPIPDRDIETLLRGYPIRSFVIGMLAADDPPIGVGRGIRNGSWHQQADPGQP
jgi:hypothetical protein